MKLAEHANSLVTNVQGDVQNFGIGNASVVIDILRKRMYGKPKQTLVQEYICNARDAMREVGKGNDFEVTVPTHLNPVFKVRDFGPGISPDRMSNVFILYGASTKRDSNTQTGGFGIGAKSAWAYTDSFTIVTIVDGLKRSYVAHTGVDNNGRLDLVSTEPTTEKNGTEIQVAVQRHDVREFRDAVLRAIYFWEHKPKLRGEVDAPTLVKGFNIGNALEVIKAELIPNYIDESAYSSDGSPIAVIDGVPYAIGESLLKHCPVLKKLCDFVRLKPIFHLGNGVVDVSASREAIADSPKTKEALEKLANKTFMEVRTHIGDQFKGVKSPGEYIARYKTLNSAFNVEKGFAEYKGYTISGEYVIGDALKKVKITDVHCLGKYGRSRVDKITKIPLGLELAAIHNRRIRLDTFDNIFFIDQEESLIIQNKRIRAHFDSGKDRLILIQAEDGLKTEFKQVVKDLEVKDFQTLTFAVLPKEQRVKIAREKTEFCVHTTERNGVKYLTLADNTQKWFYVTIGKNGWELPLNEMRELNEYLNDTQQIRICGLAGRALEMVQGNANFSSLKEWLDNFKPSVKELNYAKMLKSKYREYVETLSLITGIKDNELVEIVKAYKPFMSLGRMEAFPERLLRRVNEEKEVKEFADQDEEFGKLLKRTYPLMLAVGVGYGSKREAQEFVHYLNAKYKESK